MKTRQIHWRTSLVCLLLNLFTALISLAQPNIPNAVPGECYVQCYLPRQYEQVTESLLIKEGNTQILCQPPILDTLQKKILVQEGYTTYQFEEATFKYVEEQVLVKDSVIRYQTIPAVYDTVKEIRRIKGASTDWKLKEDINCLNANPKDCFIYCLEDIPAIYNEYSQLVLNTPDQLQRIVDPPIYKTIQKKVIDQEAKLVKVDIPPKYELQEVIVVRTPATYREVTIPAEYGTITTNRPLRPHGPSDYLRMDKNGQLSRIDRPVPKAN